MYYKNSNDFINNFNLILIRRLTQDDITFIIPEYLRPDYALEIEYYDNCQSGDFIVLRNKPVNLNNDYQIIEHYCDELAEIILSRFSLIMQSKFSKIFLSDIQDETINQFINKLYNGAPFIKTDNYIDPEEDIIDLGSDFVTTALVEMKREYQNKVSELSNF
ncbi:upper collar connector [Staphylococcus phage S-CoN_Ph35]|nr:upper collar connector [Staphylococcus phage S-CoN_Ph35]